MMTSILSENAKSTQVLSSSRKIKIFFLILNLSLPIFNLKIDGLLQDKLFLQNTKDACIQYNQERIKVYLPVCNHVHGTLYNEIWYHTKYKILSINFRKR